MRGQSQQLSVTAAIAVGIDVADRLKITDQGYETSDFFGAMTIATEHASCKRT